MFSANSLSFGLRPASSNVQGVIVSFLFPINIDSKVGHSFTIGS